MIRMIVDMGQMYDVFTFLQMAIMLELDHPNIIKLLDFFEKKDHFYMVVEKVRGEKEKPNGWLQLRAYAPYSS